MTQALSVVPLGRDATINRNTGSSFASPTYTEIPNIQDVTLTGTKAKNDASVRGKNFKRYSMGMKDLGLAFKLVLRREDAGYEALRDAWENDTPIELAALDGPAVASSGAYGPHADWEIEEFSRAEPVDGFIAYDVKCCIAATANDLEYENFE